MDISVLVQDASTATPCTNCAGDRPHDQTREVCPEYPATLEAATNKLFRAAQFLLPESGRWEMQVRSRVCTERRWLAVNWKRPGRCRNGKRCGRGLVGPWWRSCIIRYSSSGSAERT